MVLGERRRLTTCCEKVIFPAASSTASQLLPDRKNRDADSVELIRATTSDEIGQANVAI